MKKQISVITVASIVFSIDIVAIAIAILRAIILDRSPMRYFGENGYMTWLSTLQLIVAAILCWQISLWRINRSKAPRSQKINKSVLFWRITSIAMLFFAVDETLEIHENLDKAIHILLGIESTSFSGRLDDFIVLFYACCGLLTIYLFRQEIVKYKQSLPWFISGIFFSIATIALDAIGHNRETFSPLANDLDRLNQIHHWVSAIEEIPKILAGGAFIITLYFCKLIAQNMKHKIVERKKILVKN